MSAYAAQLKLYAAIYAEMTGVWPSRLEIAPLAGAAEQVPFTQHECVELLEEAVRLRDKVNDIVSSGPSLAISIGHLATPSEAACGYCAYRPQCTPYLERSDAAAGNWPADVRGRVIDIRALGNGRRMVTLDAGETTVRIRALSQDPERHPALQSAEAGDALAAFNLRGDGSPTSFTEGPFTVLYELDPRKEPLDPSRG